MKLLALSMRNTAFSHRPQLKATANGWYIAGNFVFGGLIGWFIVDPLTGKMYNLSPKEINATLGQKSAKKDRDGDAKGILKFVLLQDVPESLRSRMREID